MSLHLQIRDRKGSVVYYERMASYGIFKEFREVWAKLLGFDLKQMDSFGGPQPWTNEPLQPFFHHPDDKGDISWKDAVVILEQAKRDAPKLPDMAAEFQVLIAACEEAVKQKTSIIFC